jgi:hypothetical protein
MADAQGKPKVGFLSIAGKRKKRKRKRKRAQRSRELLGAEKAYA